MLDRTDAIIEGARAKRLPPTTSSVNPTNRDMPNVVVVGGGVAGLTLATRLGRTLGRRNLARITLVDRSWVHVWKPILHTFAAGTWNIYEQQVQFVAHAREHHFEYVPGQLDDIDRAARRIRLAPLQASGEVVTSGRELDYDVLVRPSAAAPTILARRGSLKTATSSTARTRLTLSVLGYGRMWCAPSPRE
jgi:NADPH-dependent 2,4-dienoyl-CoA reductase/sulfur reductase-like enzyme